MQYAGLSLQRNKQSIELSDTQGIMRLNRGRHLLTMQLPYAAVMTLLRFVVPNGIMRLCGQSSFRHILRIITHSL